MGTGQALIMARPTHFRFPAHARASASGPEGGHGLNLDWLPKPHAVTILSQ